MTATGSNWPAGHTINVSWEVPATGLGNVIVDNNGNFGITFLVPSTAATGQHNVYFNDIEGRTFNVSTFTVTPPQSGGGSGISYCCSSGSTGNIIGVSIGKYINLNKVPDYLLHVDPMSMTPPPWNIYPQNISFYFKDVNTQDNKSTVLIDFAYLSKGGNVQFDWYDNKDNIIQGSSWSYHIPDPPNTPGIKWLRYSVYAWPGEISKSGHYYVKITTSWGNERIDFDVIPTNSILHTPPDLGLKVPIIPFYKKDSKGEDWYVLPWNYEGGKLLGEALDKYKDTTASPEYTKKISEKYPSFPNIRKSKEFKSDIFGTIETMQVNDMSNSHGVEPNTGIPWDLWGECVSFVKTLTLHDENTDYWYAGNYVMNSSDVTPGTAVATFPQTSIDAISIASRKVNDGLPLYDGNDIK